MNKFLINIILFVSLLMIQASCTESSLKVGMGETVITPAENLQMAGFARSQVSTGVHDDLHARSLVIEDDSNNVVLFMTVSLVSISDPMAESIRKGIEEKTGIPSEGIVITATHTHAGPRVKKDSAYFDFVIEKCVESAVIAWETRVPGRIGIESGEVFDLGKNRRRLLYGGLHPDPEVAVIKIEDKKGKLLGIAFNYGCHPSGLDWQNTLISEDWPYFAIKGIKDRVGDHVWVAYYQGAEGNINVGYTAELSAVGAEMPIRNYWYIEKKGNQMAEAILKILPTISTNDNQIVKTARAHFEYPLRDSYPVTVREAEKSLSEAKTKLETLKNKPEFLHTRTLDNAYVDVFSENQKLNGAKRFYNRDPDVKTITVEQQVVRIGDAVFVTFPGELFAEIGLRIKNSSPYDKTFVIGLTAGGRGYLPAASEFIDGDYEVNGSIYGMQTEEACVDFSIELIRKVVE